MVDDKKLPAPVSNTEDEELDGPAAAAAILNRMGDARRATLLARMQDKDPEITQKIQSNLLTFGDLADLTPQGAQTLIAEIDHKDLVVSLKTAPATVKEVLLANMSERRRKVVHEDFAALPKMRLAEVEEAQRRIVSKYDELRTSGAIRTQATSDEWV